MKVALLKLALTMSLILTSALLAGCGLGGPFSLNMAPSTIPNFDAAAPGGVTVNDIQAIHDWMTDGNCGNSGGCTGATPNYGINYGITNPSIDGKTSEFYIGGNAAFTGGYMYRVWKGGVQPSNVISQLLYQFDMYVPSSALSVYQAIEWECQQSKNGLTYNFAWQLDNESNHVRVFNFTTKHWEDTGVPYTSLLTPDKWHHIVVSHRATTSAVYHNWIEIDGVRLNINLGHAASNTGFGDQFTNAFQLDLNGSASDYSVFIDRMAVTYWP